MTAPAGVETDFEMGSITGNRSKPTLKLSGVPALGSPGLCNKDSVPRMTPAMATSGQAPFRWACL